MNKNTAVNKSRYGRISTKRKFDEEFENSLGESSRKVVVGLPLKRNKAKTSVSKNGRLNPGSAIVKRLSIGDMVWAKTGKYPVWPGIIIIDPESNTFSKIENNVPMLHVYYCNDAYKRNWTRLNQIFEFSDKNKILGEFPKTMSQLSRRKLKAQWNRAVDEAACLAGMNKNERIEAFFANNFLPHITLHKINDDQLNIVGNNSNDEASTSNTTQREMLQAQTSTATVVTKFEYEQNDSQNEFNPLMIDNLPREHPRVLIPELCKQFYNKDLVTGTGGGISIKYNNQIFIAPSGVQKERLQPEDIFVQDMNGKDIEVPPPEKMLCKSQCTPIFMCSYIERKAGAVIHTHSPNVVKLCFLNPGNELQIKDLEMIKGIYNEKKKRYYENDEEVIIPIIENSKYEKDLVDTFKTVLKKYPSTSAVVVRNHGIYVWGKDWKSTKTQYECYEYMFGVMIFKLTNNV